LKNYASIFTPQRKKYTHQQKIPNSGQAPDSFSKEPMGAVPVHPYADVIV